MNEIIQASASTSQKVQTSAIKVWDKIAAFGGTQKFVPSLINDVVVAGSGIGAVRTVKLHGGGEITEKLTYLDPSTYLIKYIILSTPMPIQQYEATTKINPIDDKTCEVRFESSYKVSEDLQQDIYAIIKKFQEEFISNLHL